MEKELKIFKEGVGNHTLKEFFEISARHYKMFFDSDIEIKEFDLLWATKDLADGDRDHIMTVTEIKEDGGVIMRTVRSTFTKDVREFKEGEVFKTIATWREVE